MPQIVIFTDIDNTLIQSHIIKNNKIIHEKNYGNIKSIIEKLNEKKIPLILCSSKTRMEQIKIRKECSISDPFIVENGGALYIPENYFTCNNFDFVNNKDIKIKKIQNFHVIEFGKSFLHISRMLNEIRKEFNIDFKVFHDYTENELVKKIGIPIDDVKLMLNREYGETILEINENYVERMVKICKDYDLNMIKGSLYYTVSSLHDKGKAVSILKKIFQTNTAENFDFVAIGDAMNDLPMLINVDHPFLVRNSHNQYANIQLANLKKADGVGPFGWEEIVRQYL
ncbi:MAG: HAD-IIB family hydrolase [Nitrososphaeraceae archaeon]